MIHKLMNHPPHHARIHHVYDDYGFIPAKYASCILLPLMFLFLILSILCFMFAFSASGEPVSLNVSCTCYYSGETGSYVTATGKRTSTKYIAVSRDVEKLFPMHTKILLTCGVNRIYAIVEDRMGCDKRFKPCKPWYRKVDIFKTTKKACNTWGIKRGCRLEAVK